MLNQQHQNFKILLIEDNTGDHLLIKEYLGEAKIKAKLLIANTLKEALEILNSSNDFDVILLDLSLPDANGKELVKTIIEKTGKIPVIVLTGFLDKDFGTQTISLGVSDYLLKDELNPANLLKSITYSIERNKFKFQLKDSEEKYRQLYDLSPIPMWVYDIETLKFLSVNKSAEMQYGYSKQEFLNMTIADIRQKNDTKSVEDIKKLNQTSNSYVVTNTHIAKNGKILRVEINSSEIIYDNKRSRLVLSNDITIREMNEKILELENKIFEMNASPTVSFNKVLEKLVVSIEELIPNSFCTILKIEKDNTIKSLLNGKSIPKEFINIIDGKSVEQLEFPCNMAISKSETIIIKDFENDKEWNHLIETASKFNIKGCVATPIKSSWGKVLGSFIVYYKQFKSPDKLEILLIERVAGFLGIILENHFTLKEVTVSNEKYEILAKATSDTIWDWDIANDTMKYNEGILHMFGYIAEEVANMANWWKDKIHPEDLNLVSNHLNLFFKQKTKHLQLEYRFLCADGNYKYILDRAFAIYNEQGEPIRMIGAMQDITEQKNSIDAISRQNAKLREIAWTQSHIVRAPLSRIMGLVDLLKNYSEDGMNLKDILRNISVSADELDYIVRDIVNKTEQINIK